MQVDIKSLSIKPLRNTFDQVARFTGNDKSASRYLEATIGIQPEVNFHYKPLWSKNRGLYDKANTVIVMNDWYRLLDPRQYYYGAWTIARSKQQDAAERNFVFVEKRNMLENMPAEMREKIITTFLPLRHTEYASNLNNTYMSAYGYGVSITQAASMSAMDRLGIAQYITRIGLMLDGNSGDALKTAKAAWQNSPTWQPMRELTENMLTTQDWFELFVAQNFVLDGLVYPLMYQSFNDVTSATGQTSFTMMTEFMSEWFEEHMRWVDNVMKVAASESKANNAQLGKWIQQWQAQILIALQPVAQQALGGAAQAGLDTAVAQLTARLNKSGIQ
jgi:phenol/toluene 2-monooxygenase (NADH) P1/A1